MASEWLNSPSAVLSQLCSKRSNHLGLIKNEQSLPFSGSLCSFSNILILIGLYVTPLLQVHCITALHYRGWSQKFESDHHGNTE